mmetsp:Transcript_33494/g.88428  ORF Transcript_33494/g.88428 Transcript_33494/m.88428 type:complete len:227 (-) Transcript_33494:19-699(-)
MVHVPLLLSSSAHLHNQLCLKHLAWSVPKVSLHVSATPWVMHAPSDHSQALSISAHSLSILMSHDGSGRVKVGKHFPESWLHSHNPSAAAHSARFGNCEQGFRCRYCGRSLDIALHVPSPLSSSTHLQMPTPAQLLMSLPIHLHSLFMASWPGFIVHLPVPKSSWPQEHMSPTSAHLFSSSPKSSKHLSSAAPRSLPSLGIVHSPSIQRQRPPVCLHLISSVPKCA